MNFELETISCEIKFYFKIFIGIILLLMSIPIIPIVPFIYVSYHSFYGKYGIIRIIKSSLGLIDRSFQKILKFKTFTFTIYGNKDF